MKNKLNYIKLLGKIFRVSQSGKQEKYPALSNTDIKVCTYLKLNLSTKEIAQLMNISVRGVEISRYRLRKKLEIPSGVTLNDFLGNVV